jgi:hypothetical protein
MSIIEDPVPMIPLNMPAATPTVNTRTYSMVRVFVEIIRISDVEEMGLTSTAHDLWYVNFPRLATNGRRG